MRNVHRKGILQHSEPVTRIAQVFNPTNLVLSIVHKTLIEFGKMRGSLHHHIGLLLVALEAGDVVEGTIVVHIPFGRDVVLRISDSEREWTWTKYFFRNSSHFFTDKQFSNSRRV